MGVGFGANRLGASLAVRTRIPSIQSASPVPAPGSIHLVAISCARWGNPPLLLMDSTTGSHFAFRTMVANGNQFSDPGRLTFAPNTSIHQPHLWLVQRADAMKSATFSVEACLVLV